MNARLAAMVLVGAVAFVGLEPAFNSTIFAQAANPAAPVIPPEAQRASTNIEIGRQRAAVDTFVAYHVQRLLGADPTARSASRDALANAVPSNATIVYFKAFGDSLNAALTPDIAQAGGVERLNAAICVARVSERTGNSSLAGVTRQLLKDPIEAVVLWAVKSAGPMVPYIADNTLDPNVPLIAELVETAKAKSDSPWIIDEAYTALVSGLTRAGANPTPQQIGIVVPQVQALLQHRIGQYATAVPPVPVADTRATTFLTSTVVWNTFTDKQKLAVVQQMSDLLNNAANQFAGSNDRARLSQMITLVGKAYWVVGASIRSQQIQDASTAVTQVNQSTAPGDVKQGVAGLLAVTKGVPTFATLRTDAPAAATQPTATARRAE